MAPAQLFATMLATVAVVTLASAAILRDGPGAPRLPDRYLPYPLVGLIGGLGVLLVIGGLELAVPSLGSADSWMSGVRRAGGNRSFGTVLWLLR